MKWIKVTLTSGVMIHVNIDRATIISVNDVGAKVYFSDTVDYILVKESPEQIIQLTN